MSARETPFHNTVSPCPAFRSPASSAALRAVVPAHLLTFPQLNFHRVRSTVKPRGADVYTPPGHVVRRCL